MSRQRSFLTVLILALIVAGAVVAAVTERASVWRDRDIRIDGQDDDWQGLQIPVKGEHFSLGVVNDGEFLYLCLPTKDAGTKELIQGEGLIVWLDRKGGKKNQFGVHFPIRVADRPGARGDRPGREQRGGEPQEGQPAGPPPENVAILGPGSKDSRVVPLGQSGGIEARVAMHDDLMVYELKVPLQKSEDHPYAPDLKPGDLVHMTLETPTMPGGRAPLGTAPGRGGVVIGGGPGGWGGGIVIAGGRRVGPQMTKPLDVTMDVQLARGPEK